MFNTMKNVEVIQGQRVKNMRFSRREGSIVNRILQLNRLQFMRIRRRCRRLEIESNKNIRIERTKFVLKH